MNPGGVTKTAFHNFMDKCAAEYRKKGHTVDDPGYREILLQTVKCRWWCLSDDEKRAFNSATHPPVQPVLPKRIPKPSPVPTTWKQDKRNEELLHMKATGVITKLLDLNQQRNIEDRIFVVVEVSSYARLSKSVFIPAEIGLSAFTLNSGIVGNYATLIDPGDFPSTSLALRETCKELTLPSPPFSKDSRNYSAIWESINRFIGQVEPQNNMRYIFCQQERMGEVKGVFEILRSKLDVQMNFEVLPLGILLQRFDHLGREMYNLGQQQRRTASGGVYAKSVGYTTNQNRPIIALRPGKEQLFPVPALADQYFNQTRLEVFDFDLYACAHHMENSNGRNSCPLGKANKLALITLNHLIPYFGIAPIEGAHRQLENTAAERERRRRNLAVWGNTGGGTTTGTTGH